MPICLMEVLESNESQTEEREDIHNDSTSSASTKTTSMGTIDQGCCNIMYYSKVSNSCEFTIDKSEKYNEVRPRCGLNWTRNSSTYS